MYATDPGTGSGRVLQLPVAPTAAATTTTLTSSANPLPAGNPVTVAGIVPAPGGGTFRFTDGGTPIAGCSAVPVPVARAATCTEPASQLGFGGHNIVATYSGTTGFAGSTSATLTEVVSLSACRTLAGANLAGANLAGANLAGANLPAST